MNKCEHCGKTEKETRIVFYKKKKYLCNAHRIQMMRFGRIKDVTVFDRNKIVVKDNFCKMELYNSKGAIIGIATFDKENLEKVKNIRWGIEGRGYVWSSKLNVKFHQYVKGVKKGFVIDHKNRNKLDNRKSNLRYATKSQNAMNKKACGVYYRKNLKKWTSEITFNKNRKYLGVFNTKKEALKVRKNAELKYFKEFAYARNYN